MHVNGWMDALRPTGKSMVLPEDLSNGKGLVLVATSTGTSTFRGFLHRLFPDPATKPRGGANAQSAAFAEGGGKCLVILGGQSAESIPYAKEFQALSDRVGVSFAYIHELWPYY